VNDGPVEPGHRRYLFLWRDAIKGWKDRREKASGLSAGARATAMNLSTYMRTSFGTAAVGLRRLAYDRGTSPKTELRNLNELRQAKFLAWDKGGGPGHPSHYQARFPDGWFDEEPLPPEESVECDQPLTPDVTDGQHQPLHTGSEPLHMGQGTVSPGSNKTLIGNSQENSNGFRDSNHLGAEEGQETRLLIQRRMSGFGTSRKSEKKTCSYEDCDRDHIANHHLCHFHRQAEIQAG
jgi:hypothetical protein